MSAGSLVVTQTCDLCKGEGVLLSLCPPGSIPCPDCEGRGRAAVVPREWAELGRKARAIRGGLWLTLGAVSRRMGERPSVVSSMERGRLDPEPLLRQLAVEVRRVG